MRLSLFTVLAFSLSLSGVVTAQKEDVARPDMSMDECIAQNGVAIEDNGDGAIHEDDYVCTFSGLPPLGTVISVEGGNSQVCCEVVTLTGGGGMGGDGMGLPLPDPVTARDELSRQDCLDASGIIVGDIGNGAIFRDDYVCENNGLPPIANIIQQGDNIAIEGEVCCPDANPLPLPDPITDRDELSRQDCIDANGIIVGDIGNGAIFRDDYVCESNGLPPFANIIQQGDNIAIEGEVCCAEADPMLELLPEMTDEECTEQDGVLVEDNRSPVAIQQSNYVCESSGEPPLGIVITTSSQAISRSGALCCKVVDTTGPDGLPLPDPAEREEFTRQECTDANGIIVGDIGNGAIFEEDYVCENNGLLPLANIIQQGDNIAIDGEVCCGEDGDNNDADSILESGGSAAFVKTTLIAVSVGLHVVFMFAL